MSSKKTKNDVFRLWDEQTLGFIRSFFIEPTLERIDVEIPGYLGMDPDEREAAFAGLAASRPKAGQSVWLPVGRGGVRVHAGCETTLFVDSPASMFSFDPFDHDIGDPLAFYVAAGPCMMCDEDDFPTDEELEDGDGDDEASCDADVPVAHVGGYDVYGLDSYDPDHELARLNPEYVCALIAHDLVRTLHFVTLEDATRAVITGGPLQARSTMIEPLCSRFSYSIDGYRVSVAAPLPTNAEFSETLGFLRSLPAYRGGDSPEVYDGGSVEDYRRTDPSARRSRGWKTDLMVRIVDGMLRAEPTREGRKRHRRGFWDDACEKVNEAILLAQERQKSGPSLRRSGTKIKDSGPYLDGDSLQRAYRQAKRRWSAGGDES